LLANEMKPIFHKRDVFHAWMVKGAKFAGPMDMPVMEPCYVIPTKLVAFSDAMSAKHCERRGFVHFYEDDADIERFWNNPKKYLSRLAEFDGVIAPDYSVCYDFPNALKVNNTYRNLASGSWLQAQGLNVIPNVRCEPKNADWSLPAIPHNSLIAFGARASIRRVDGRGMFVSMVRVAVDELHPSGIVWYGADAYGTADYPRSLGIPVYVFPGKGRGNLGGDCSGRV
jgi:hypothetical protein